MNEIDDARQRNVPEENVFDQSFIAMAFAAIMVMVAGFGFIAPY